MKCILTLIASLVIISCSAQEVDSAWISKSYFPALANDTGLALPPVKLTDESGKQIDLLAYRGKILFIDVWSPYCGNCIGNFPRAKKLNERLKYIHLDTAFQFINICSETSKAQWKKLVKKYQPEGVNLFATDTVIFDSWKIGPLPFYALVGRDGKIMCLDGIDVRDGNIDYIMYAATKGVKPGVAVWEEYRQQRYYRTYNKYTNDEEGRDFSIWFKSIVDKLIEDSGQKVVH